MLSLIWAVVHALLWSPVLEACVSEPPMDTYFSRPRVPAAPIASVKVTYRYAEMNQPLWLEHTGRSLLAETLDGNKGGGFAIDTLPGDSLQKGTEVYRPVHYELRSIRVRAPGLHAGKPLVAGTTASSQVLELALLHREKLPNGEDGNWAVVYIPFAQSDGALTNDPLLPFVEDADFPSQKGQTGHAQLRIPWKLADFMPPGTSATMLHYWGKLVMPPCGPNTLARHIVREDPIAVAPATLAPILAVLERAAENAEFMTYSAPTNVWKLPLCSAFASSCNAILPYEKGWTETKKELKVRLMAATTEREAARTNLQQAQAALNNSLVQLKDEDKLKALTNRSSNQLILAQQLAAALQAAEDRMEGARVNEVEAAANLQALPSSSSKWDIERPERNITGNQPFAIGKADLFGSSGNASSTTSTASNATNENAIPVSSTAEDEVTNSTASTATSDLSLLNLVLGAEDTEESKDSSSSADSGASTANLITGMQSCAQWHGNGAEGGLSPIDIKTADVADLASLSEVASSPVVFRYDGDLGEGSSRRLWLENTGGSFRATALPSDSAAPGGPFGIFSLGSGGLFELNTVELKVPGEHSVDGEALAAELQLIHHRQGADDAEHEPVIMLAMRLTEDDSDNPWLEALINTLPRMDEGMEVYGAPLWSAGAGLAATSGSPPFYRYDGTTTSPPCRTAHWFMLEDPGYISTRQLNALKLLLMPKPAPLRQPLGERIVVRDSPIALQKKSARALLQALRQNRLRSTGSLAP